MLSIDLTIKSANNFGVMERANNFGHEKELTRLVPLHRANNVRLASGANNRR